MFFLSSEFVSEDCDGCYMVAMIKIDGWLELMLL